MRIRKDPGDLTLEDFEYAPFWQNCLDEEGIDGQDECTMKPVRPKGPLNLITVMGLVVMDCESASGRYFVGGFGPTSDDNAPRGVRKRNRDGHPSDLWYAAPFIMLPRKVGRIIKDPLIREYNSMLVHSSPRVSLYLPMKHWKPPEPTRALRDLSYEALGVTASELFPLTCTARCAMRQWPRKFVLPGFIQPVTKDGNTFKFLK